MEAGLASTTDLSFWSLATRLFLSSLSDRIFKADSPSASFSQSSWNLSASQSSLNSCGGMFEGIIENTIDWEQLLSSLPVLKFCTHTHSHNDYKVILGSFKTVLATLLCLLLHTYSTACILWLGVYSIPTGPAVQSRKHNFDSYPILLPFLVFIKPYKSHLVNISSPSKSVHLSLQT